MKTFTHEIVLDSKKKFEFIDITREVVKACEQSGVRDGTVTVFTRHTTAAVKVNERCEKLQTDMEGILKTLVPDADYAHDTDTVDSRKNARGHIMSLLVGASETIPVAQGRPDIGTWQSIFFLEFDGPRKNRTVVVKVMGA